MKNIQTFTLKEINKAMNGALIALNDPEAEIHEIVIDSRRFIKGDKALFFALVSDSNDGHKYLTECYQKGVRNFVISVLPGNLKELKDANVILVKNTRKALQMLGSNHRKKYSIPIIGITGSNGKTIVKEWLYQVLYEQKNIVKSPKSYNSQIGVPLSVWQINNKHDIAIFEAGISKEDEMANLQKIIDPTIGIFTNIGRAHDENFNSTEDKVDEKLELFKKSKCIIYCKDHEIISERIKNHALCKKVKCFTWSTTSKADLIIDSISKRGGKTKITATYNSKSQSISIPFIDDASVENAIHCWATLLYLGFKNSFFSARFANLSPVAMRLELKQGINQCSIINDSYNSDLDSLRIALDFLNQHKQPKKKTIILSDILQSGINETSLYMQVAEMLKEKNINRIIGIGDSISRRANDFEMDKEFYLNTDEFLMKYTASMFHNEVILLKGARHFQFEKISKLIQQKSHETQLQINLNALVQNLNFFRSKLKPETKVMAMVKAFSYGSGSYEIANILQFQNADYLAVAYTDEGIELRKAGIMVPIMVMNPDPNSIEQIIQYNLEPEVYNFRILDEIIKLMNTDYAEEKWEIPIHIKLDTGMHRLGFVEKDQKELCSKIHHNPRLKIKSVFSHLAGSDNPNMDDFTRKQFSLFENYADQIQALTGQSFLKHILNSSGVMRFTDKQYDMIRVGLGLYGISPDKNTAEQLQHVSSLRSIISQIKEINKGEGVGYDHSWIANKKTTLAILPIGYADGLSRSLSNEKGFVIVNNTKAPIVGNISMDMCIADITGIEAKEGDEVIIFGQELPIELLAENMNTIPYEVISSISQRVKRVYHFE